MGVLSIGFGSGATKASASSGAGGVATGAGLIGVAWIGAGGATIGAAGTVGNGAVGVTALGGSTGATGFGVGAATGAAGAAGADTTRADSEPRPPNADVTSSGTSTRFWSVRRDSCWGRIWGRISPNGKDTGVTSCEASVVKRSGACCRNWPNEILTLPLASCAIASASGTEIRVSGEAGFNVRDLSVSGSVATIPFSDTVTVSFAELADAGVAAGVAAATGVALATFFSATGADVAGRGGALGGEGGETGFSSAGLLNRFLNRLNILCWF